MRFRLYVKGCCRGIAVFDDERLSRILVRSWVGCRISHRLLMRCPRRSPFYVTVVLACRCIFRLAVRSIYGSVPEHDLTSCLVSLKYVVSYCCSDICVGTQRSRTCDDTSLLMIYLAKTSILAYREHGVELPLSARGLGKIFRVASMSEWDAGDEGSCYGVGYTLHVYL
ncbi:uncharacterized protein EV420DRAFT_1520183 [Desarmillaria tabescens]|uniref:Uncharacterized protein n=1 Tax=Armillaria tabescens TaxID=1929756 RepID=A0AA39T4E7_ARMTA|nr:uncharacterized protein EV420DRAFT_1520183 [Desarmillaria tabescens]KAK0463811.1 hypothetical protein EV420DRAFT_1520183 [Desarmillaria tabescens]